MEYMELEWPLIVFTFFMCLSGGLFATQAYLALRGRSSSIQLTTWVTSVIALALGGLGVFLHLEHWERLFNGFGHITSPITHEVIGVVVFALVLVLYLLFMRRSQNGLPPKWCSVLAIIVGLAMPVLCGRSYMMPAEPIWDTAFLLLFYLADAILMGTFACFIIAKVKKEESALRPLLLFTVLGAIGRLIIIVGYAIAIYTMSGSYTGIEYYFDPTVPDLPVVDPTHYLHAILAGDLSLIFYLAVILIGSIVPLVIALVMTRRKNAQTALASSAKSLNAVTAASIALMCAIAGGVVWRCILYWVGLQTFPYFSL